jgi:hypothetical protein
MSEEKLSGNMNRRSFMLRTAIAGSILSTSFIAMHNVFAMNKSELQLVKQILLDAIITKDIQVALRKYGAALTLDQKNVLLKLTRADLTALASIYRKLRLGPDLRF